MKSLLYIIFLVSFWIVNSTSCKKPYAPPAIQEDNKFLVIDGALVNSIDSPSVFTFSRTIKLTDTTTASSPEPGANVSVEGNTGETFAFTEMPGGIYKSNPLLLNSADKYRLKIITASGDLYLSDFVEVRQTPAIDSITWQQQNDVTIYANTHDPSNSTTYYRWDFIETWQYRSQLESELGQKNGMIFYADTDTTQMYNCWSSAYSTNISVGSSVALGNDVISMAPVNLILQNSEKIGIRYSILVKQYAITDKAYQYFQILKKNTENLGSIFDAQPTQLSGNIHSVNNPSEIVIGYFTASSVQQKRIFINRTQLTDWKPLVEGRTCDILVIDQHLNYLEYDYPDPEFGPYYFSGSTGLVLSRRSCLDCITGRHIQHKPSYW